MDNVAVKLAAPPVPEFNYFVDNQVLTAGQLNTVTDYLERQHRLTRARLMGAGIICGLQVTVGTGNTRITVGKGSALTSDGDLINLENDLNVSFYRAFADTKARYDKWAGLQLLELLESKEIDSNNTAQELKNLGNLDQMVVCLYLESYLRPPEDCTDTDCDNLGPKQINKLRVLLLNQQDVQKNNLSGEPALPPIPVPAVRRVVMSGAAVTGSNNLGNRIEQAIADSKSNLKNALAFVADNYGHITGTTGFGNNWTVLLDNIAAVKDLDNGVQYAWAALKDIARALRELNEHTAALRSVCMLPPGLFPKHIALGGFMARNSNLRHGFIESPQWNNGALQRQRIAAHLLRLDAMLRHFEVPKIQKTVITPSQTTGPLGNRAVPAYFKAETARFWNFELQLQGYGATVRGYHVTPDAADPAAAEPLAFTHDDCNFYRIEGILGMEKDAVLQQLVDLRNRYNLPFRVEGIQIENDLSRIVLPPKIKLPYWENAWHLQRENLFDHLHLAKDYAGKLNLADTPIDSQVTEDSEVRAKVNSARSLAADMDQKLQDASDAVYVNAQTFAQNYTRFRASYTDAVKMGYDINNNIQQITQTATESPLHQFAVFNKTFQLDRLVDIFHKKTDLVKRQYIFDNFQNQHPGLEHLGGVSVGGTFVVVHQNDRVVADFCLPYAVEFDLDPDIELTQPPIAVRPPIKLIDPGKFKWLDKFHYFKDTGITKAIDFKIVSFEEKFNQEAITSNNFVKDWLLPTLSQKNTDKLGNTDTGGTKFSDSVLGTKADGLSKQHELIRYYESKSTLTDKERKTYESLVAEYDENYTNTVKEYSSRANDIQAGSEDANLLAIMSDQYSRLSAGSKSMMTVLNTEKNNLNIEDKPNIAKNIGVIKFVK